MPSDKSRTAPVNVHVIGGAAGIGRWLIEKIFPNAFCYDINPAALGNLASPAQPFLLGQPLDYRPYFDHFLPSDWILLAVPPSALEDSIRALAPALKPETLVVTAASVQEPAIRLLAEFTPQSCTFCGCHPLFGPSVPSPVGQIAAFTGFDEANVQHVRFRDKLSHFGLISTTLGAAEHDRYMSYVQALTHFCLIGFAATLAKDGVRPGDLMRVKTPNFKFLYAFASRVLKLTPTTTGAIQFTSDASFVRRALLETLSSLHKGFEMAESASQAAEIIADIRRPLSGAEIDEGVETASIAVDHLQRFESLLHRYRESQAPFLFRRRPKATDKRKEMDKVVRIVDVRHDEIMYQQSMIAREGRVAVGLSAQAVENYRRMGIEFPKPSAPGEVVKKRNIRLFSPDEVRAFYREKVIPATTDYTFKNPDALKQEHFENWLPLVVPDLWKCEFRNSFQLPDAETRVTLGLTFDPNRSREEMIERVRQAVEERRLLSAD